MKKEGERERESERERDRERETETERQRARVEEQTTNYYLLSSTIISTNDILTAAHF